MLSLYLQAAILVLLPLIYTIGASVIFWSNLGKPWYFVIASLVSLYALYLAVLSFGTPPMQGYFLEYPQNIPLDKQKPDPIFDFIGPYLLRMFVFSVLVVPAFWVLIRLFRKQ